MLTRQSKLYADTNRSANIYINTIKTIIYKIARAPTTVAKHETKCFTVRSKRFNCFMHCKAENIFSSKELATGIINLG